MDHLPYHSSTDGRLDHFYFCLLSPMLCTFGPSHGSSLLTTRGLWLSTYGLRQSCPLPAAPAGTAPPGGPLHVTTP